MSEKTAESHAGPGGYKWKQIAKLKDFNMESPENFEKWRTITFADGLGVRNLAEYNERDPYTREETRARRGLPEGLPKKLEPLVEIPARLPEDQNPTEQEKLAHAEKC